MSKAVTFGTDEVAIRIERADGDALEVRFADGSVTLDGATLGSYMRGGALEESWRALLTRAVQLDDGPLRTVLVEWEPPTGEVDEGAEIGASIDAALEAFLATPETPLATPPAPPTPPSERTVTELLSRLDLLGNLSALLGEVRVNDLRVAVGEDFEVGPGMVVDGSVLVVDGDVEIAGRIDGDLFVADGDIEFRSGGVVEGDLRHTDGHLDLNDGIVRGEISEVDADRIVVDATFEDRLREEFRADLRDELRAERPRPRRIGILGRIGRTIESVFDLLVTVFVLGLFGVMVNFFAESRLDRVAEAARRAPGRATMVGFAAGFLSLPVFLIGILGLVVSLIGIPLLLLWLPGFPLAVAIAAGLGYVAVARNIGSWAVRQRIPGLEWMSVTRPNSLIFGGVLLLLAPHFVAILLGLAGGWFEGLQDLATFVGVMAGLGATVAGFGAVLITRAGDRTGFATEDWYSDLRDLGADLGDLRGFASGLGRSWTGGDRSSTPETPETPETPAPDADDSTDTPTDGQDPWDGPDEGPGEDPDNDPDEDTDEDPEPRGGTE
ncbi:MAG: hypothetical protein RQ745_03680 [Longimicrobiales bacterium]|nr:hypothetical protein [Longimicrobiales bacterium]